MKHFGILALLLGVFFPSFGLGQDIFSLVQGGQVEKGREALKADPKLANAVDRAGRTPIYLAVSTGNLDMVRLLVDNSAAVRVGDNSLRAPIHFADWAGHKEMIDIQCNSLTTPLYFAVLNNNPDYFRYLVQAGAAGGRIK